MDFKTFLVGVGLITYAIFSCGWLIFFVCVGVSAWRDSKDDIDEELDELDEIEALEKRVDAIEKKLETL
jgi:hypothetical protein